MNALFGFRKLFHSTMSLAWCVAVLFCVLAQSASGQVWQQTSAPIQDWTGVAASADATKLVAVAYSGSIYTSTDSGATWTQRAFTQNWQAVASSADGVKLVAVAYGG